MAEIHDWSFKLRAKPVRDRANADPTTRCWRCGRTLAEVRRAEPGRTVAWHAGHTVTGDRWSPLLAECSVCNLRDAAKTTTLKRRSSGGTQRF